MFFKTAILSLLLLTGCVSQTVHWGAWSGWSEWKPTEKSETRNLKITSEPLNCEIFINDRLAGSTPLDATLPYTILQSEREQKKYQTTHSNWSLEWLLLGKGDKPGTSKVIDSEKEIHNTLKSMTHKVVVKREGYRPASKFVSQNDSFAHFILKEKLCLFFNNIKVEDESKLSVTQKIYDAIFKKKYEKAIKPEDLQNMLESDKHFKELFIFSGKKGGCNWLNSELIIRDDYTVLSVTVLDGKGSSIVEASSRFKTGFERDGFLSDLKKEIDKEAYKIYRTLCEE